MSSRKRSAIENHFDVFPNLYILEVCTANATCSLVLAGGNLLLEKTERLYLDPGRSAAKRILLRSL